MAKPAKSQWDFGELFPVEPSRRILSVSELTVQVRRLLEKEFGQVWVTGEVTNLRVQSSGHIYFTLKDASAQLSCVLFRGETQVDRTALQDGRKINLRGEITVYEPRGQYQLRVLAVELQGLGALQAAFDRLKQKLKDQGWFAPERKRALPRYPQRIGLVTSSSGAAIRDVLHVVARRNPSLEVVLAPCRVQGEGAAAEIAAAIRMLNDLDSAARRAGPGSIGKGLDLILLTRGGGSLEDLWAFNEETVARAIFESGLPIVSAVGHEIDFTISDFVADLRAATPSAGAEIITEGVFSSCQFIHAAADRLNLLARQHLEDLHYELRRTGQRLERVHPRRRLEAHLQLLDDLETALRRCSRQGVRRYRQLWEEFSNRLARSRPGQVIKRKAETLGRLNLRLSAGARHRYRESAQRLGAAQGRLKLLGPDHVLARGYSITLDETGAVLRDARHARDGQLLRTRLKQGSVISRVEGSSSSGH